MLNFLWFFAKAFFETIIVMIKSCVGLIPVILDLKKSFSYITPKGIVALYLGVPVFVITALIFVLKFIIKRRKRNL